MKFKLLLILSFVYGNLIAQTDWERWDADNSVFQLKGIQERDYSLDKSNVGMMALTALRDLYWFAFSDLDGDNCPFHPTCSSFFVEAVKKTNLLQGLLMFADRFTRDTNFFKGFNHYEIDETGKFFDPVDNYTLTGTYIRKQSYHKRKYKLK